MSEKVPGIGHLGTSIFSPWHVWIWGRTKRDMEASDGKLKVLKLTWNDIRLNRVLGLFIGESSFG